jgi:hypothetical protein
MWMIDQVKDHFFVQWSSLFLQVMDSLRLKELAKISRQQIIASGQ